MTPYYEQDGIVIYHGEAERVLPLLSPVDLLLTDPPYGIGEARGRNKTRSNVAAARDYGVSDWDDMPPPRWLVDQAIAKARHAVIFGGNYFHLPPAKCWLVWDKDNTGDFADCELAWTNLDKAVRRLMYRWNGMLQEPGMPKEARVHPTQKPEPVMRWALLQAPQDVRTVLDPFMGSGTTLVACKRLGRRAIGIERDERYCAAAVERLRQSALPLEMGA